MIVKLNYEKTHCGTLCNMHQDDGIYITSVECFNAQYCVELSDAATVNSVLNLISFVKTGEVWRS